MKQLLDLCTRYLLVSVTCSYAAGIVFSSGVSPPLFWLPVTAFLLFLSLAAWLLRGNGTAAVLLLVCMFLIGCIHSDARRSQTRFPSNLHDLAARSPDVVIVGVVEELVLGDGQTAKALLGSPHYRTRERPEFTPLPGPLLVSLRGAWPQHVLPGDHIALRGLLKRPSTIQTPGTFDYRSYLARDGIHLIAVVRSPVLIQPIEAEQGDNTGSLRYRIERYRAQIALRLNELLPAETAGLYRAILIGDKSGIPAATLEAFKGAGVMHILAISGLHLALLGFLFYGAILALLKCPERLMLATDIRKLAMGLSLLPLFVYTLLAGAGPPVVRSFIMALCVVIALGVNRRRSPVTLLAGAALAILLIDPLGLEDVSFQLSFAAVASLILLAPAIYRLLYPPDQDVPDNHIRQTVMRWLWGAISVSLAASIGTMPLLLYYFNRFSLVTIPANLVVEPLICLWSLPLGILALPLLHLFPALSAPLLQVGAPGLELSIFVATSLSSLEFSTLWLPDPQTWSIVLYFGGIVCISISPPLAYSRQVGILLLLFCTALFLAPLTGLPGRFRTQDRVTVVDIGHGNANLIELAGGRNILIDGGGQAAPGFDPGARILAPFLWQRGIARLDDIIISHADADHYNGIPALVQRFRPHRIWLPGPEASKSGLEAVRRLAEAEGIALISPTNRAIFSDSGSSLVLLAPASRSLTDEDDRGVVLRLETPAFSVMFPGDIGTRRERELIDSNSPLKSDILLAAHHGSSTSNSLPFLAEVSPRYLIVSTGDTDGGRFPSYQTLRNAENRGITVLTTARNGTVQITGTEGGYTLSTYREGEAGWQER